MSAEAGPGVGVEPTREAAWEILTEFTRSDSLLKHALAVECCMRSYARRFEEEEDLWGVVGLLHDFDYEKYPEPPEHATRGNEILTERGWPSVVREAILSHAEWTGVPRDSLLKKTLFACDELSGFITAVALVRPSKKIAEVKVRSVKKKMKDKGFARAVSREDITTGAESLGLPLEEHIGHCIESMQGEATSLGL